MCSCFHASDGVFSTENSVEVMSDADISIPDETSDETSEETSEEANEELWNGTYVVFESGSRIVGVRSSSVLQDADQYKSYRSIYSEYNTYTYYSTLNEAEKFIYRIFEYAFDNSYSNLYFDEKLLEKVTYPLGDILYMLTLDSPLVEQNVRISVIPFVKTLKDDDGNFVRDLKGSQVYVSTFFTNRNENKDEAIKKAKEIISKMPQNLTDIEKARYFYRYLGENVKYKDYKPYVPKHYLYDALCGGASNCDGYANAFSLLCNMQGIDCVEKMQFADTEDERGHTWNSVLLDGVWYNVDPTGSEEVSNRCPVWKYFGFSDNLPEYDHELHENAPDCEADMIKPALSFNSINDNNVVYRSAKALREAKERYVVVSFKEEVSTSHHVFQEIAQSAGSYMCSVSEFGELYYCVLWYE